METKQQVTHLLLELNKGNRSVLDELSAHVYNELRRLASGYLRNESFNATINTTDLVHEAYLRLVGESDYNWQNRAHFMAIAARAMRQFLVYYAKRKNAVKRGGGNLAVTFDERVVSVEDKKEELLALDEALNKLITYDERLCKIVELRYFTGLSIEETAKTLKISPATVKREWSTAKAWLHSQMN